MPPCGETNALTHSKWHAKTMMWPWSACAPLIKRKLNPRRGLQPMTKRLTESRGIKERKTGKTVK
jgi:hypothetical protein